MRDNRGSVLILVLFVLGLLTVFCVQLSYGVRQKLALVSRLEAREKIRLATAAGVEAEIALIRGGKGAEDMSFRYDDGIFKQEGDRRVLETYFCRVETTIEDEAGKININKADSRILRNLFQNAAALDESPATALAFCIIDWRDANSNYQHPQYGAEDSDYNRPPSPYEAKDAEFEMLEELRLIKGMTDDIYDAVEGHLTVYGTGETNINTASEEVLLALGLSEELTGKIASFRLGEDSAAGTEDDNEFTKTSDIVEYLKGVTQLSDGEVNKLNDMISKKVLTTDTGYFKIRSVGKALSKNVTLEIVSVVKNDGAIVFWCEE